MVKKLSFYLALATLSTSSLADYESHIRLGISTYSIQYDTGNETFNNLDTKGTSFYLAAGVHNRYNRHYLGAGLDVTQVADQTLIGFKAVDYQFEWSESWRTGAFIGAATWDTGLPQNGYYAGLNLSRNRLWQGAGITAQLQYGSGLARDRILETDPQPEPGEIARPDIFANIASFSLSLDWRF